MPITQSSREAGRAAAAQSQSTPTGNRPSVQIEDLAVGCVVWLPVNRSSHDGGEIKCIKEGCCDEQKLDDEGYDHPALILQVSARTKICTIAQVTSKSGKNGSDRIAISQDEPAPQSHGRHSDATVLYLERDSMKKQSYVRLAHIYQVEAGTLRTYGFRRGSRACDLRLREESYQLLMSKLASEPKPWVDTAELGRTVPLPAQRRHTHHLQPLPHHVQPLPHYVQPLPRYVQPLPHHAQPVPPTHRLPGPTYPATSPSPYRHAAGYPISALDAASRAREAEHRPLLQGLPRYHEYSPPERPLTRPDGSDGGFNRCHFVGLVVLLVVGVRVWRSWK